MSTPTTSAPPAQPSSASKKAAGHVTTPSNRNIASPAPPRSVPSPAASRKEQSGKTPANHSTVSSYGSKTLGGTPMMPSLSQSGNTSSSPGQNFGSFGTPGALHGLGVDLGNGTPGGVTPGTLLAAAGMMPSMSEIMGVSSGSKRNEDEERRAKLRNVLKKIGKPKGRVSGDGVARLARRVGMVATSDTNERTRETTITMAGSGEKVLVDVKFRESVAHEVKVEITHETEKDTDLPQGRPAGQVLLQDLSVSDGILLHSKLDNFAANLDRLARADLLSKDSVDCFVAIGGLYESLTKLYELEKNALKASGRTEHDAEREVLRKKSGRPSIHENGKIGLALDYWTLGSSKHQAKQDESAMDIDGSDGSRATAMFTPQTWTLRIEAEASPAGIYPPLRVSDQWLGPTQDISPDGWPENIPWGDPPQTFIGGPSANSGDAMSMDAHKLPDLRFVAKLDPPLILPLPAAAAVLSNVELSLAQMTMYPIYHLKLLGIASQDVTRKVQAEQKVLSRRDGQEVEVTHQSVLHVSRAELGYKLEELPFSHPKQLVELLPTLRQWALVGSLLQNSFAEGLADTLPDGTPVGSDESPLNSHPNGTNGTPPADDNILDDLLHDAPATSDRLRLDIGLTTSPHPVLSIAYGDTDTADVCNLVLQILPNADVVMSDDEDVAMAKIDLSGHAPDAAPFDAKHKRLARGLEVGGDVDVWVEWMRSRQS